MKRLLLLFVLCFWPVAAGAETLVISEVCSNNDLLWNMDFVDYVELYNAGDTDIDLSNYALSRDEDELLNCVLPHVTLAPDEYVLLLCNGSELSFNLPKKGFTLYLTLAAEERICDQVEIPPLEDTYWTFDKGVIPYPSPGQPNTYEGYAAYRAAISQGLVINEVVSSNLNVLETDDEKYDLIELCNLGTEDVLLSDYYLSDKKKKLIHSQLPDRTLRPGEYTILYASGEERRGHVGFKVSSEGETLYLTHKDGMCVDAIHVPQLESDTSYGRMGMELVYFEKPTIGRQNGEGSVWQLKEPAISLPTGLYSESVELTFAGEGDIYYSLNGDDPRDKGILWDGTPVHIEKNTIVRACAKADDAMFSHVTVCHYLFDCEKYELPILSLSSAYNGILGGQGIWKQHQNTHLEKETHAAYIEEGQVRFSLFCGVRLHGAGSRKLDKKSFQLRFRSRYGQSTLNDPIFDEIDFDQYDALVLRCGSQDYRSAFLRDEFLTSLAGEAMPSMLYQVNKPVNLFVDGQYFGIYYIREKVNDTYVSYHLGGDAEKVDMIMGWKNAEHGRADDFKALLATCKHKNLADPEIFAQVEAQVCLENVIDYYIARIYTGDRDYGNIRHVRAEGGKWHIVFFDLDFGFGTDPVGFGGYIGTVKEESNLNTVLINGLLKNPGFRVQMLERLSYHLENTFAPDRVIAHLDEMVAEISHDMCYDRERWGFSMEHWARNVEHLRQFARKRVSQLVESATKTFRMTDEEVAKYFGNLVCL